VVQRVQLVGIEELPGFAIARKGIVFVGTPQPPRDLDEFGGAAIARFVVEMLVQSIVGRRAAIAAGHHVPPCPALADQIERCEPAREVEGCIVRCGECADKADAAGRDRQRRQQRQRFQPVEIMRRGIFGDQLAVDNEHQVEFGRLGLAHDIDIPVDVDAGIARDFRIEPAIVLPRPANAGGDKAKVKFAMIGHDSFLQIRTCRARSRRTGAARPASRKPHRMCWSRLWC
jgi:hypothetical protein